MGTSKSYGGPIGATPLLPPWANEPLVGGQDPLPPIPETTPAIESPFVVTEGEPVDIPLQTGTWDRPRRDIKRLAGSTLRGRASHGRLSRIVRDSIHASGAARGATLGSRAGRATTRALGSFLSNIAARGVAAVSRSLGIEAYLGGDVETFLAGVVAAIAPDAALSEDAIANAALVETLAELFDDYAASADGLLALDRINEETIRATLERFVGNYISNRLMYALSERIEAGSTNGSQYVSLENDLRDYVRATVALDFGDLQLKTFDWSSGNAQVLADRILAEGYRMLERAR